MVKINVGGKTPPAKGGGGGRKKKEVDLGTLGNLDVQQALCDIRLAMAIIADRGAEVLAYARVYGPQEGFGLYADERQTIYSGDGKGIPDPELTAEAVFDHYWKDDIPQELVEAYQALLAILKLAFNKIPVRSWEGFCLKQLPEWKELDKILSGYNQDGGRVMPPSKPSLKIRKTAPGAKNHIVLPGEEPLTHIQPKHEDPEDQENELEEWEKDDPLAVAGEDADWYVED